jgi:hypothetical protein
LRNRSLFWPGLIILVGLIALLVNTGVLSGDRAVELILLWPLILIVIGVEIVVRRSLRGSAADVAALLVIVVAIGGALGYVAFAPIPPTTGTLDRKGAVGELTSASVEINAGSAEVTMTSGAELGSDLYRLHIAYSGGQPDVRFDSTGGSLVIDQNGGSFMGFRPQRFVMTMQLNPSVTWSIAENAGSSKEKLDLTNTRVSAITVSAGASTGEITLGPASGVVPIRVEGGSITVHVHRPAGTAASADVSGGALSLNADGHNMHAVGELKYETSGFSSATDGYRIEVSGGSCTVTLDTATKSA